MGLGGAGSFRDVWHRGVYMGLDCQGSRGYYVLGVSRV